MRLKSWVACAVAVATLVPVAARAAEEEEPFKYAYVNMERLIDEYVLFREAKEDAEKQIEEARVEDKARLAEYQAQIDELEAKLAGPLTEEAKAESTAQYKAMVEEALEFRNSVIAKYKRIERDAFEPVYKNVYEKIESYALKEDYDVVFDYSAIMLYANEEYDITEDIVTELNEEAGITR
ncbi:MAG: OmpH family outer membrane protein [Candidatus Coatesbacteria bacterium]|nr:MAG: OmpH family outer membrane protein [Candidatus Coatesbacteria bacterium]